MKQLCVTFMRGIHRDRWFPSQRVSNAENVSVLWHHHKLHRTLKDLLIGHIHYVFNLIEENPFIIKVPSVKCFWSIPYSKIVSVTLYYSHSHRVCIGIATALRQKFSRIHPISPYINAMRPFGGIRHNGYLFDIMLTQCSLMTTHGIIVNSGSGNGLLPDGGSHVLRPQCHDDVIKWKHFSPYWPFVRGIHRPLVNSHHKGQRRGALLFSSICAWANGWVNNRGADDLRRHRAHYYVIVMCIRYHQQKSMRCRHQCALTSRHGATEAQQLSITTRSVL